MVKYGQFHMIELVSGNKYDNMDSIVSRRIALISLVYIFLKGCYIIFIFF